jgi:hypothetical protein
MTLFFINNHFSLSINLTIAQSVDKQSIKAQTIKTTISHQRQKQSSIHYISCDKPPITGTTTTTTTTNTVVKFP